MNYFTLLAAAPATLSWNPNVAIVMISCNVLAIVIGKLTIQKPNEGPELPMSPMFGGLSLPALLGVTSFGHILGAGVILGLANLGAL